MYGSFMRLRAKPGQEQAVADVLKQWETELKPNIKGAIGGLLLKADSGSGELHGAAIFEDKASYMANADNPAQHEWYVKLRDLLESDPEWTDGEYLSVDLG